MLKILISLSFKLYKFRQNLADKKKKYGLRIANKKLVKNCKSLE